MFVEKLCVVTGPGFYWRKPDKVAPAEILCNLQTVLCDRVTNRPKQNVERNRFLHFRHLLYRGKLYKFLNKFKSDGRLPSSTTKAHYFRDCQDNVVRWPVTRWSHLTQSSIGGRFQPLRQVGGVLIRTASVPRVEIVWRVDGVAKVTGSGPVPVHGLRHIQTVQPRLTIPLRTDFEIRWDMSHYAHIEGAFQISFRQGLWKSGMLVLALVWTAARLE